MTKKESYSNLYKINARLGERSNDFRYNALTGLLLEGLKQGSLLDIGCGSGYYLDCFRRKGFSVKGIEPNPDMVKACNRLFRECHVIEDVAENISKHFRANSFDNIVMIDVLEHIEKDAEVLRKCHKILKRGGRLVIVVPAYFWLWGKRDIKYGHYRRYGKKHLESLLNEYGFKIKNIRFWNMLLLFPYMLMRNASMEEEYISMRSGKGIANSMLGWWFNNIENKVNFRFGINLICFAKKQ